MSRRVSLFGLALAVGFALVLIASSVQSSSEDVQAASPAGEPVAARDVQLGDEYIVLAWNDLGMHCYNRDFQYLAILPPANTLWAQVIKIGDPPQIVTTGLTVTYEIVDNTFSVGKSNFWDYDQDLYPFGDLPPNVGITGNGLSGTMAVEHDYFIAEAIPLTEFRDSDYAANPTDPEPYPYQVARVEVWDASTGEKLAQVLPVAPVSTEMHCEFCHSDNGEGNDDIATGDVELNILTLHDEEHAEEYPPEYPDPLVDSTPVRCSKCHASNALPLPGVAGIPNLSHAMHEEHAEPIPDTREGCYNCHPGPQTRCQRDVMSEQFGMTCIDCHGGMESVASNPQPWLNQPRCDAQGCHPAQSYPSNLLYRQAQDHYGVYCEGCHDSPHAIAPSREANDRVKFLAWQGYPGALRKCTACHATAPASGGPHGLVALTPRVYLPLVMR